MADCRLTTADDIRVMLDGATITVSLHGVALGADEVARVTVLQEGPETRCRLEACTVADSPRADTHDYEESFALGVPPHTVVIEHAGGEKAFEFDVRAMPPDLGPTRGDTTWRDIAAEPSDEPMPDWAPQGPIVHVPTSAPPDAARADYGGGAHPDATGQAPAPSIGRAEPMAPRSGGWIKGWSNRWFKRGIEAAAPQATPGDDPRPAPSPGPPPAADFEGEPTAAMGDDPGPTAAMEGDASPPTPAEPPPSPEMGTGDGPTSATANGHGAEPSAPKGLFPRLDAPEFFPVGVPEGIVVGVRSDEDATLGGGPMPLPPDTDENLFILSIEVIADGFDIAGNTKSLLHDLAVTKNQRFPFVELTLVARPIDGLAKAATIDVIYTVADQVIGKAKRAVAIATQKEEAANVELPDVAIKTAMSLPVGETAADLTVVILTDDAGPEGRLKWAFKTPHSVDIPERARSTDIGRRPAEFAEAVRRNAERAEGKPTMLKTMRGIGRSIASAMHDDFWQVYDGVRKVNPNPTVLILSEEPHVPWELAILPAEIDPTNDRFLAAEAVTGRWLLSDGPKMPPPDQLVMKSMAVVFGEYNKSKFNELKEAKAEMESLTSAFGAKPVRATQAALNELLDGKPSAEVLHFAIHGKFGQEGADLLLEDNSALGPFTIEGSNLSGAPLVFLNACQVGAGNELLGEFAGMAEAFLSAGASAVIAPLWSVRDDIAREISLRFYPAAFGGETPAEVLRRERASFAATDPPLSSTFLAYQFYGHPAFRLSK